MIMQEMRQLEVLKLQEKSNINNSENDVGNNKKFPTLFLVKSIEKDNLYMYNIND